MRARSTNVQLIAMFSVIIITFFGSALFFSTLNTETQRSHIQTEAELTSSLLASGLDAEIDEALVTSGQMNPEMFQKVFTDGNPLGGDNDVWILSKDGTVLCSNKKETDFNFFQAGAGVDLDASVLQEAQEKGLCVRWLGKGIPFLMRQQCCVVRPVYDGREFQVLINRGDSVQATQRQQFALLMGIELVLMVVMVVLITNIITDYKKQIIRLATKDELTGLSNRKSFNTEFAEYMQQPKAPECSLFLLDIDFFKQINDNYGHAAGDNALRFLSSQIQRLIGEVGGFAGRWGGDEFIGVLPLTGQAAHEALITLCRRIEEAHLEDGFQMTISAGVADNDGETSLSKLSEKADLALYESKEHGRNQASLYHAGMVAEGPQQSVSKVQTSVQEAQAAAPETQTASADAESSAPAPISREDRDQMTIWQLIVFRLKDYFLHKLIQSTIMGVQWMAPFVAGGGMLIGLAFLFDAASVDLSSLSVAARANFGSITPLAATLKDIGGITFNFMLPVFAGFMAYGIAGEDAYMAGFVGGYMTIDSNSGFIGAMIAGFAAGVIATEIQRFTNRLPVFVRKAAPIVIYPVFNLLLMQGLSWVIITPLSSALGKLFTFLLDGAVASNSVLAGGLSAMMMATDMGGIVNKVAYNYAVNGLAAGQTGVMAAVMVGGMVPPVGIFLSMLLFRKKYTEKEWDRGYGTLFMGLSFITEGALPYVFTDVMRVIPSCMAGSAVAGCLSAAFGCQLPAPHGGIFVFPVMTHPLPYAVALLAGSMVTAGILGIWKKDASSPLPSE